MRIAVYYDLLPGGAAFALERFVAHLRGGHEVTCFAPRGAHAVVPDVHYVGAEPRALPAAFPYLDRLTILRKLRSLAREEARLAETLSRHDRVLVNSCRDRGAPAILSHLAGRSHFYVTEPLRLYREPRPPDGAPQLGWWASRALYAPVWQKLNTDDRKNARRAGTLLANSRYTASQVKRHYDCEATVAYPSVDPRFFASESAGPGSYVLSPGALIPQKGHGRVVRAMAGWRDAPELVVAGFRGRTGYPRRLLSLARRLGVRMRMVTDPAPREMLRLVQEAGVVAVASVQEPFGLVSLEAQAASRPVIVVDEGGLPETVVRGITGLVAGKDPKALAEAIRTLWGDLPFRERMAKAAREHVRETFSEARCGVALERLLR